MFTGKGVVADYVRFRPDYPLAVYEAIFSYCGMTPGHQHSLSVDLACGPGNSTRPLAEHFDRVIGIDISEDQIFEARKSLIKAEFRLGRAEDLSFLGEHSVDLITSFMGLQWLNTEQLFIEVKRVLRTDGVFAAFGYAAPQVECNRAKQLIHEVSGSHLVSIFIKIFNSLAPGKCSCNFLL